MTRIIEATRKDGTRQLLPTSLFRGYVAEAQAVAGTNSDKRFRVFGQMLANLMYVRGYVRMVQIDYDCNGQRRTVIMEKKGCRA